MTIINQVFWSMTPYSLTIRYTVPFVGTSDLLRYGDMSTDLQSPTSMIIQLGCDNVLNERPASLLSDQHAVMRQTASISCITAVRISDLAVLTHHNRQYRNSSLFTATCNNSQSSRRDAAVNRFCAKTSIFWGKTLHHCNRFWANLCHF